MRRFMVRKRWDNLFDLENNSYQEKNGTNINHNYNFRKIPFFIRVIFVICARSLVNFKRWERRNYHFDILSISLARSNKLLLRQRRPLLCVFICIKYSAFHPSSPTLGNRFEASNANEAKRNYPQGFPDARSTFYARLVPSSFVSSK